MIKLGLSIDPDEEQVVDADEGKAPELEQAEESKMEDVD